MDIDHEERQATDLAELRRSVRERAGLGGPGTSRHGTRMLSGSGSDTSSIAGSPVGAISFDPTSLEHIVSWQWPRELQLISMKLIIKQILLACPSFIGRSARLPT